MDSKRLKRNLPISLIVISLSLGNYSRLSGTENIRAIHVVTLLTCGIGIGLFLSSLMMLIRNKKN